MASVQRCAAQHPGRRAAETVCRQFQCPRLHFSRRHLRQIRLSWRHGYPSAQESGAVKTQSSSRGVCSGLGDCPVCWPTTWKRSPSVSPSGTSFGSLHRRLRQQTVLRRLNTKHPPGKGPFAVRAAPVLSPWLPSVASGSPDGGSGRGVRFRGARHFRRGLLVLLARPAGRCSASRLRGPGPCAGGWLPPSPWLGCAPPPGRRFLRSRSILQHTGAGPAPATPATSLPQPPPERKAPWKPRADPLPPLPRRESRVVPVVRAAGGSVCQNGRQPSGSSRRLFPDVAPGTGAR